MEKHPVYQFEKYSDNACLAIAEARRWAETQQCSLLSSHYILAGLLETEPDLLKRFFHNQALPLEEIFAQIRSRKNEQEPGSNHLNNVSNISLKILSRAAAEATYSQSKQIETTHILNSLIKEPKSIGSEILEVVARQVTAQQARAEKKPSQKIYSSKTHRISKLKNKEQSLLEKYCFNLTKAARAGKLPPMIGREKELAQVLHILGRKTKNNPLLVGEAGVGKTAILEGLAQRIVAEDVHETFRGKTVLSLDLTSVISGTKYRGEFEERLREILDTVKVRDDILLFVDEVHTIIGVGASEGALDAANIMKPALARGELHCIGATTPQEYQLHFTQDKALARRFQPVTVDEPDEEAVRRIVYGIREHYEIFHQVLLSDAVIEHAIYLSRHYLPDRAMPDKVIDLIDEACSRAKLESRGNGLQPVQLKATTLQKIISNWTGLPVHDLHFNEKHALRELEKRLQREIFGQNEAITEIAKAVRRRRTGIQSSSKPVGVFLFTGPTGVGKTALAQALARQLMGSDAALIRLDMTEFKESHSIAKLIGAPPGYVGFQQMSYLAEKIRKHPYSVVLLDEIEKAHTDVFNLMLQVFDEGILRDAKGTEINFRHALIIMTSNLQGKQKQTTAFGFGAPENKSSSRVPEHIRDFFAPEFINRLDRVIEFASLAEDELHRIVKKRLREINADLKPQKVLVEISAGVREKIVQDALQEKNTVHARSGV